MNADGLHLKKYKYTPSKLSIKVHYGFKKTITTNIKTIIRK